MQCVRIERNRDSSTTYRFSELGSADVRQHLEAQLALTPSEQELLQESGYSTDGSAAGSVDGGELAEALSPRSSSGSSSSGSLLEASGSEGEYGYSEGGTVTRTREADDAPSPSGRHAGLNGLPGGGPDASPLELAWTGPSAPHPILPFPGEHSGAGPSSHTAREILELDAEHGEALSLLAFYSDLCSEGRLDAALTVVEKFVRAGRRDVLIKLKQRHFFRAAARQASPVAAQQALAFVRALPREFASLQTYTMLVSACVAARDMATAMQAATMLRASGRKPDTILYTNLITACAKAGDADAAFRLYGEMAADGLRTDKHVVTALIDACGQEIQACCTGSQRRRQLVLLERAGNTLHEYVRRFKGSVDRGVWNAYITAAGRAAQLDRAVRALEEMQASGLKPDGTTYGAVLDACVRNRQPRLAQQMFRRAMEAGATDNLHVYTAAIAACRAQRDSATALDIFAQLRRHGLQPDERLYGVLISVVGASSLQSALDLQAEVQRSGVAPLRGILSNLMEACLEAGDLPAARRIFAQAAEARVALSPASTNGVINACARQGDLAAVAELVSLAIRAGSRPDKFTVAAALHACQRCEAGELAFRLWRSVQQQGTAMDEAICFTLVRICYNRLQAGRGGKRRPRGAARKPEPVSARTSAQLLAAFAGGKAEGIPPKEDGDGERKPWADLALSAYQELLAAGAKPSLRLLERLLACLRLRPLPGRPSVNDSYGAPLKMRLFRLLDGRKGSAPQHSCEGIYERRALTVLEEAAAVGALPPAAARPGGGARLVDLRGVPPVVAEVHVLSLLAALVQPGSRRRREDDATIVIKVPPFVNWRDDKSRGHKPAAAQPAKAPPAAAAAASSGSRQKPAGRLTRSGTGPCIATLLRRLDIRFVGNPANGDIVLTPGTLVRWTQLAERAASSVGMASLSSLQKAGHLRSSIQDQQRAIRLGMPSPREQGLGHQPERGRFLQRHRPGGGEAMWGPTPAAREGPTPA